MNRAETTKFLSDLLVHDRFSGIGKYYASEVSIDPWTNHAKRIDFMQFIPENQMSVSGIEKGIFVCYEVKSCKEDIYSGNGLNFIGEKNYIVTTMECWESIRDDIIDGTLERFLKEKHPGSSDRYGVLVAVPDGKKLTDEFESPTPLDSKVDGWKLKTVIPCMSGFRERSMAELLFCMLRSGK
mgnify:CR=1 FL=1|nr:MAG TPA: hypothetical protein [Caudoviricetes sp.]